MFIIYDIKEKTLNSRTVLTEIDPLTRSKSNVQLDVYQQYISLFGPFGPISMQQVRAIDLERHIEIPKKEWSEELKSEAQNLKADKLVSVSSDKKQGNATAETETNLSGYSNIEGQLFYPITFPVTTGAGTISVLFTLSAHSISSDRSDYFMNTAAILSAIIVMCILIYIFYLNTKNIIRYLSSNAEAIFNRISAFLIFCVGLQIAITGIKSLMK